MAYKLTIPLLFTLFYYLSWVDLLQAYPFQETQSSKIQDKSLQNRPDELSVLDNLLIDMLLSLSATDFPKVAEVSKLPRTKMFSCMTDDQYDLDRLCEYLPFIEGGNSPGNKAMLNETSSAKFAHFMQEVRKYDGPKPPPLIVLECTFLVPGTSDNVTGQIAKENMFKMFIHGTLLTDDQKCAALKDLASCMSSDLTLPKQISAYTNSNLAEAMNKNWIMHLPWDADSAIRMGGAAGRKESYYQTLIKNAMCLARAVVQNGCPNTSG